ncbi:MAG: acyl carrier protein [Clostridia bacterium]|nr:acyl carrier protein [Clostridia bacterium]
MEFEKVKKVIAEQMGVDEASISKDTSFVDDLGADSLDVVELVMALEEEFDMEFSDGEAENMKTIGDVVEYIKAQM